MAEGRLLEVVQGPGVSQFLFHSYPLQEETNSSAMHGVPAKCHVCTYSLRVQREAVVGQGAEA